VPLFIYAARLVRLKSQQLGAVRPNREVKMTTSRKFPNVRDIADDFNCSTSTIWRWVADGKFPKPFKIGGLTIWDDGEIDSMIDSAKRDRGEAA